MLAIAPKASLRNPPVLISPSIAVHLVVRFISCHTDEATSALNTTSRILVFEALKHWRTDRRTTLPLSSKRMCLVEQRSRYDLEAKSE